MKKLLTTIILMTGLSVVSLAQNRSDSTGRTKPIIDEQTKQDLKQSATRAEEKLDEEIDKSRDYQQTHQLNWFQPNNLFAGGGLGMGATSGQVYLDANLRAGYFSSRALRLDYVTTSIGWLAINTTLVKLARLSGIIPFGPVSAAFWVPV